MGIAEIIQQDWGNAVAIAAGCWALYRTFSAGRVVHRKERADLIKIAQEAAASVIESLQSRIATLEAELSALRKEHADTVTSKDAELALLRGQVRHWMAVADAYERQLTEAGVPHKQPAQPLWRVEAGDKPVDLEI